MNNENSDTGVFLIIFTAIAFVILKNFLLSIFIAVWKWPMMAFLFPLVYLPTEITNDGIFFWINVDMQEKAISYIKILSLDSMVIVEQYVDKDFITTVNKFASTVIAPILIYVFIHHTYKMYKVVNPEFKKAHSMDSLLESQSDIWPQVKPMINVHPERIEDLDEGEWAMGQEPYYFAETNGILIKEENKLGEEVLKLDESKAIETFQKQVGRPWNGVEDLNLYEKYIYSILISKTCRSTELSRTLVKLIATALTTEKKYSKRQLNRFKKEADELVEETIEKFKNHEKVQDVIREHFYLKTIFAKMLETSRLDGVLAPADFLWLKIKDRGLWYMLNNVGRHTAWSECAGVWYHFNYEKAIKRKIPSPMIIGGVIALDLAFRESSESYSPLKKYNKSLN